MQVQLVILTLDFIEEGVIRKSITCYFTELMLLCNYAICVDGRKWSCQFSQPVQKSGCNFQLRKMKVHLVAKKKMPGIPWTDLEVMNSEC